MDGASRAVPPHVRDVRQDGELPPLSARAVALVSGGLDSLLAARLVVDQGLDVRGVTFSSDFGCGAGASGGCGASPSSASAGFPITYSHLGREYIQLVRAPRFGYGSQLNPCIDCRHAMVQAAWCYARHVGASWLITGEVLAQRPMSQRRAVMRDMDHRLGLTGRVLRPLSARLLQPTAMEEAGIVDRSRLLAIHGRERRSQLALARARGIEHFAEPGGGCLLTQERYADRARDLFRFVPAEREVPARDVRLLQLGRHFRVSLALKLVVARDEAECAALVAHRERADWLLTPVGRAGATALAVGEPGAFGLALCARAAACYAKAAPGERVSFDVQGPDGASALEVERPADRAWLAALVV